MLPDTVTLDATTYIVLVAGVTILFAATTLAASKLLDALVDRWHARHDARSTAAERSFLSGEWSE